MSVQLIQHPILNHYLTKLRAKETEPPQFRMLMTQISRLMIYEAMRDAKTKDITIETPLERTQSPRLDETPVIISIMRAGNGMLDGVLQTLPEASIGHIGIYRDKFIKSTVEYYFRLPKHVHGRRAILLDPLLATGSTVVAAVSRLKQYGVSKIHLLSILAAPEGLKLLEETHPDVKISCLSIERQLNSSGYILPGLGDAGDRLYDTVDH